ncbi:hypothetical protein PAXINDRAFT_169303 [Paxillus involutus ATCC 200175]|uniref:Uncharacterized protein n=1 Tax=Paxillus involutus ATCC 200175 TaxID=664439 RepID=A0A0C9U6U1_PAXIN|nr:hypothetical protein PAXINDRAFT_169303 [Paxillus involutus ATCC 200175]
MPLGIVYLIVDCLSPRDFVAASAVFPDKLSKVVERPNHLEKAVSGTSATAWSS